MAKHNTDGTAAEAEVAQYLDHKGFKIIGTNWKTRWCEVDIIAKKDGCLHFVEVKYRGSSAAGSGFDYITSNKLRKMDLAARSWVEINGWSGEYVLSAAQVSGKDYDIEFIEQI